MDTALKHVVCHLHPAKRRLEARNPGDPGGTGSPGWSEGPGRFFYSFSKIRTGMGKQEARVCVSSEEHAQIGFSSPPSLVLAGVLTVRRSYRGYTSQLQKSGTQSESSVKWVRGF